MYIHKNIHLTSSFILGVTLQYRNAFIDFARYFFEKLGIPNKIDRENNTFP